MARNPCDVQSVCSWKAGGPNAFWPSQICSLFPAKLGTPSTPSHGLEPQQLSPGTKRDFQAAWGWWALSPSQTVQSASLPSLVSQKALSRQVRGSFAGVIVIPSLLDQFGMTFLLLSWKQCLESQKREYVWHSAAARCGEERALILPSPSSHWGNVFQI